MKDNHTRSNHSQQPSPFRPLVLKIPLRQRMFVVLALPKDRHDPPTRAIVHQLNAVDAALEWFRIRSVARFVRTEDVNNLAKLFCLSGSFAFVETFLLEKSAGPFCILIDG